MDVVLRALERLHNEEAGDFELLVVGDGPNAGALKDLAAELGIDARIRWAGRCAPERVPAAISCCDVMILPTTGESLRFKGTSAMKLFEYLACGRFVIGSRCGDLAFLEEHGIGALATPDSVADWAAAFRRVLERPPPCPLESAREYVREHRSFEAVARAIRDLAFSE